MQLSEEQKAEIKAERAEALDKLIPRLHFPFIRTEESLTRRDMARCIEQFKPGQAIIWPGKTKIESDDLSLLWEVFRLRTLNGNCPLSRLDEHIRLIEKFDPDFRLKTDAELSRIPELKKLPHPAYSGRSLFDLAKAINTDITGGSGEWCYMPHLGKSLDEFCNYYRRGLEKGGDKFDCRIDEKRGEIKTRNAKNSAQGRSYTIKKYGPGDSKPDLVLIGKMQYKDNDLIWEGGLGGKYSQLEKMERFKPSQYGTSIYFSEGDLIFDSQTHQEPSFRKYHLLGLMPSREAIATQKVDPRVGRNPDEQ